MRYFWEFAETCRWVELKQIIVQFNYLYYFVRKSQQSLNVNILKRDFMEIRVTAHKAHVNFNQCFNSFSITIRETRNLINSDCQMFPMDRIIAISLYKHDSCIIISCVRFVFKSLQVWQYVFVVLRHLITYTGASQIRMSWKSSFISVIQLKLWNSCIKYIKCK